MHLRKLVPLADLLSGNARVATGSSPAQSIRPATISPKPASVQAGGGGQQRPAAAPVSAKAAAPVQTPAPVAPAGAADNGFKDKFLAELKASKSTFYNLVVASAFRIDASATGIVFTFLPNQKNAKSQCDEQKAWLQSIAEKVAGRPVPVSIAVADASASAPEKPAELRRDPAGPASGGGKASEDVKAEAMANSTVQALLEIFPVDKTTIEER